MTKEPMIMYVLAKMYYGSRLTTYGEDMSIWHLARFIAKGDNGYIVALTGDRTKLTRVNECLWNVKVEEKI